MEWEYKTGSPDDGFLSKVKRSFCLSFFFIAWGCHFSQLTTSVLGGHHKKEVVYKIILTISFKFLSTCLSYLNLLLEEVTFSPSSLSVF